MAWSAAFKAALAAPVGTPELTLTRLLWANTPGQNTAVARSKWKLHGVIGLSPGVDIVQSAQGVNVPHWSSSLGMFRIAMAGIDNGKWLAAEMPRGALCEVRMKYPTMGLPETVFLGRVNDLSGLGPQSVLDAWSFVSAMVSRPAVSSSGGEDSLFYNCIDGSTNTGTLAAAYSPGAGTLQLASSPAMQRETGKPGAVLVSPTSGTPFILTYTGTSGNNLTGVSTTAQQGTTAASAPIGSRVQEVAWIDDSVAFALLKMLTSTGTGSNGPYDTLPESWGFGVSASLIDTAGFIQVGSLMAPSSGTQEVLTVSTQVQTSALSWLQSIMQVWGVWLTMRQGQVTCRCAAARGGIGTVMTLDRNNIIAALPNRKTWDGGTAVEYGRIRVFYDGGASQQTLIPGEPLRTRPSVYTRDLETGWAIYQNWTAIIENLGARLAPWFLRIPSVVELSCTLAAAHLCPGDWVDLNHPGIWTHYTYTSTVYKAMVGSIAIDLSRAQVAVRLYIVHPGTSA